MNIRVFSGPTLPAAEIAQRLPGASIVGPVALGDVLTALEEGCEHIAIVDGYFDQTQPVWHKEILWALQQGARVYGAASMGALRAVELESFGMRGVGKIFELYRDGWLERDDEVAIVHGPAEEDYRGHSDALINMRFTFRAAARTSLIPLAFAERCTELAERMFYAERTYANVLKAVAGEPGCAELVAKLELWLAPDAGHRIDQKRADALALIAMLAQLRETGAPASRPTFQVANTHAWRAFVDSRKT